MKESISHAYFLIPVLLFWLIRHRKHCRGLSSNDICRYCTVTWEASPSDLAGTPIHHGFPTARKPCEVSPKPLAGIIRFRPVSGADGLSIPCGICPGVKKSERYYRLPGVYLSPPPDHLCRNSCRKSEKGMQRELPCWQPIHLCPCLYLRE